MRPNRPLFIVLAAIAFLAVAAFLLLWLGTKTTYARRLAGDWIETATGLPATVERLGVGILRGPALELGGVAIAQPPGFGEEPLLEVGQARLEVTWGSLFGDPVVESASIEDANARLRIAVDGSDNWSALIKRLAEQGGEGPAAWTIEKFAFERGAFDFANAASGAQWRLTAITVAAENIAPGSEFPLDLRLAALLGDNTFHLAVNGRALADPDGGLYRADRLQFRGWTGGEPLPLAGVEWVGALESASYRAETGTALVERGSFNLAGVPGGFDGQLVLGGDEAHMIFRLTTETFAPRAPAVAFGRPLPVTTDPEAYGALQLSFEGRLEDGILSFDPITGRLDDTTFEGRAVPSQRLIRVNADQVDVNRYLPPDQKRLKEKKATLEAAVAALGEFDVDAEIRIGEARVARATLRDTIVRIERNAVRAE